MRAATVVQVLQDLYCNCLLQLQKFKFYCKFYCMFYITCDGCLKAISGDDLMVLLTLDLNLRPTTLTTCSNCLTDVVLYFHDTKHESAVSALSTDITGTGRPLPCCSDTSTYSINTYRCTRHMSLVNVLLFHRLNYTTTTAVDFCFTGQFCQKIY